MRIEVKQRHIDQALALRAARGGENSSYSCPIALAVKEQAKIPLVASAVVSRLDTRLYMAGRLVGVYLHLRSAQRFIEDFDNGRPVAPRTFMLLEAKS